MSVIGAELVCLMVVSLRCGLYISLVTCSVTHTRLARVRHVSRLLFPRLLRHGHICVYVIRSPTALDNYLEA